MISMKHLIEFVLIGVAKSLDGGLAINGLEKK